MNTKELLETIQKVIPAVDSKSVVAQTDHLIFGDNLLSAYNGKIAISTPIELSISCSVPANDLLNVIKSIKDEEVDLSVEEGLLHLISNDTRATISTEVEEEAALQAILAFNLDDLFDNKGEHVPENFISCLELCIYSASRNADDIKNLNCILIDGESMYAGDGYRATEAYLEFSMDRVLIPLSSAVQLAKFDPTHYIITDGWMHLINNDDSVFSLRVVNGDFPDIAKFIDSFKADVSVILPDEIKDVVSSLGVIAESPVENFKVVEIEIIGEIIECHVEKSGVYVTKTIDFPGNKSDASILISAPMLSSILEVTNEMEISENTALFSGDEFKHLIVLAMK